MSALKPTYAWNSYETPGVLAVGTVALTLAGWVVSGQGTRVTRRLVRSNAAWLVVLEGGLVGLSISGPKPFVPSVVGYAIMVALFVLLTVLGWTVGARSAVTSLPES